MRLCRECAIVPNAVLERFAADESLSDSTRNALQTAAVHGRAWRSYRISVAPASRHAKIKPATSVKPLSPNVLIFDCKGSSTQPGHQIEMQDGLTTGPAKRILDTSTLLLAFYKSIFNRNSIDNHGMGLIASIHYGQGYSNAFWNGNQMIYGDGDGEIFQDFTSADDVLAHEFAHGVTQYTAGLGYADEPGALNESMSDVFASIFRQWRARLSTDRADWRIGTDILGPSALRRGYLCLRDLRSPGAVHCLSPQPAHFDHYDPTGDAHVNSGIPNHAFYRAAMAIGGNTWDRIGLIWYSALANGRRQPNMEFAEFAALTVHKAASLFRITPQIARAIEQAWREVGVL